MIRRLVVLFGLVALTPLLGQSPGEPATNLVDVLRSTLATTAPPSAVVESGKGTNTLHRLTEGDIVQLLVYQEEDLNLMRAPISKDGTIAHPLVGSIPIGGKTLEQAKEFIFELLRKDYLVDPRVSLTLLEYARSKFTVVGQVNRLGTYEFPSNEPFSLVQAVALAGGPTRLGNPSKIKLQRYVDGVKKEIKLDLDKKEDKAFRIQDGDLIEIGEKIW